MGQKSRDTLNSFLVGSFFRSGKYFEMIYHHDSTFDSNHQKFATTRSKIPESQGANRFI